MFATKTADRTRDELKDIAETAMTAMKQVAERAKKNSPKVADKAAEFAHSAGKQVAKAAPVALKAARKTPRRAKRLAQQTKLAKQLSRGRVIRTSLFTGAAGVAITYFFDPHAGRARRAKLRDRVVSLMHRSERITANSTTPPMHAPGFDANLNDPTIKQRVESQVLGRDAFEQVQVNVGVQDGIVVLHGEVEDPMTKRALEFAVSRVDGVRGVRNNLHAPGEPAPTAPVQENK